MARLLTVFLAVSLILGQAGIALAAPASGFRGLSLSTPYPAQTVRAGERVTLTLTVKNFGLSPQTGALRGGAGTGSFRFLVVAQGQTATAQLPLTLTVGQVLPPRLTLTAELPVLRGPATSSFRYRLTLKNESDRDLLVNLEARTQKSFQVTFTPSFASQQVTSLPVKAGESKDIDTEVSLPREAPAGTYDIAVLAAAGEARAEIKLGLEITGRPDLTLTTPDGRLSGRAYANRATPFKLVVKN